VTMDLDTWDRVMGREPHGSDARVSLCDPRACSSAAGGAIVNTASAGRLLRQPFPRRLRNIEGGLSWALTRYVRNRVWRARDPFAMRSRRESWLPATPKMRWVDPWATGLRRLQHEPSHRPGSANPEEIAASVAYLASDDAALREPARCSGSTADSPHTRPPTPRIRHPEG